MTTTRRWVSALLIFFLQTAVLPFWWQAEVRPDLWLVAVVLITLFYGPRCGSPGRAFRFVGKCRFSRCLWQVFSRRLYTIAVGGWGAYRLM